MDEFRYSMNLTFRIVLVKIMFQRLALNYVIYIENRFDTLYNSLKLTLETLF